MKAKKDVYPQMWFIPNWNQLRIIYPNGYVEVNLLDVKGEPEWSESIMSASTLQGALINLSVEAEFVGFIK